MVTPYYHTVALTNRQVLRSTQISETYVHVPPGTEGEKALQVLASHQEELKIRTLLLCGEQKAEVLTPALIHTQNAVPQCSPVSWSAPSSPESPSSTPRTKTTAPSFFPCPAPRPFPFLTACAALPRILLLGSGFLRTVIPPRARAVTDTIRSTGKNVTAFLRSPSASLAGGERRTVPAGEKAACPPHPATGGGRQGGGRHQYTQTLGWPRTGAVNLALLFNSKDLQIDLLTEARVRSLQPMIQPLPKLPEQLVSPKVADIARCFCECHLLT